MNRLGYIYIYIYIYIYVCVCVCVYTRDVTNKVYLLLGKLQQRHHIETVDKNEFSTTNQTLKMISQVESFLCPDK